MMFLMDNGGFNYCLLTQIINMWVSGSVMYFVIVVMQRTIWLEIKVNNYSLARRWVNNFSVTVLNVDIKINIRLCNIVVIFIR